MKNEETVGVVDDAFLQQLKNDFIPMIEEMIRKEKEYQVLLNKYLGKVNRIFISHAFLKAHEKFLNRSAAMIVHYEQRLKEYKQYVKDHERDKV